MSSADISNFISLVLEKLNEKPIAFFSMLSIFALTFIYSDMQSLNKAQIQYMQELTVVLKELNIRVSELEEWHRLEYNKANGIK